LLTILLVAAEKAEFAGILARCNKVQATNWNIRFGRSAEWKNCRLLLAANGPGPLLSGAATDAAGNGIGMENLDAIISTGLCGALDPALEVNGIFAASRVTAASGEPAFAASLPSTGRPFASGILISGDRFVGTVEEKRALHATGAGAVEMEALAVASRAAKNGIPFYCIRVVSDRATDEFEIDFNQMRDASGRFQLPRIVLHALAKPASRFPELMKLKRNSESAAKALGDFFDDCRF
jgi:adenosylhomocysteine nucleosidase